MISPDDVAAIFARHGVSGAWQSLSARGIANHILATDDVVLRIATDHPEARGDARTAVVAAPAETHRRDIPAAIVAAAAAETDPDRRILKMLAARGGHVAATEDGQTKRAAEAAL